MPMYGNEVQEIARMHNEALGRPASPTRIQENKSVINALGEAMALANTIDNLSLGLEERLSAVLRQLPEACPGKADPHEVAPCGLAGSIGDLHAVLVSIGRRLSSINERLEL